MNKMNKTIPEREFIEGYDDLGKDELYTPNDKIPLWPKPTNNKDHLDLLIKMRMIGWQVGIVEGDTTTGSKKSNFRKFMLCSLRNYYPDYWTYKLLADLFKISTRRVGQILEQKDEILKEWDKKFGLEGRK